MTATVLSYLIFTLHCQVNVHFKAGSTAGEILSSIEDVLLALI